jgi:recombinational DNA repair ATPase RecF
VLSAVSHYTTLGRGQPSTVTRDKNGFRINGKAVAAYSGSAQDVLGMAVRLALIKTFLPSTPFMVMDEIAAACDDNRELDMLGMVIAADIPQVLLVTHSSMAESFANQLVQL